jgi:hypothetical protein
VRAASISGLGRIPAQVLMVKFQAASNSFHLLQYSCKKINDDLLLMIKA